MAKPELEKKNFNGRIPYQYPYADSTSSYGRALDLLSTGLRFKFHVESYFVLVYHEKRVVGIGVTCDVLFLMFNPYFSFSVRSHLLCIDLLQQHISMPEITM